MQNSRLKIADGLKLKDMRVREMRNFKVTSRPLTTPTRRGVKGTGHGGGKRMVYERVRAHGPDRDSRDSGGAIFGIWNWTASFFGGS
jgi:hypothetical protein